MKKFLPVALAVTMSAVFAAENLINVSWGDNIMVGTGISKLDTPERVAESVTVWNDVFDGKIVLWRASSEVLKRFYERRPNKFQLEYDAKVDSVAAIFDPIKVAKAAARKKGQKILLYITFLDHGMPETYKYADSARFPWQDKMFIENPEYNEVALNGEYHYGVADLSNDEFRAKMIKRLVAFVKEYDSDGLYLCSRTHSNPAIHGDQFGFSKKIVAEYQKRYGIDITKDKRFDYRSPEYAPRSKEVQAWRDLRGEYLVKFVAELRQALGDKTLIIGLPSGTTMQAPYGNMTVDKKSIISQGLVDGIVTNVISGMGLYPLRKTHHRDLGFLESADYKWNVPTPEQEVALLRSYTKDKNFKIYWNAYNYGGDNIKGANGLMFNAPNCQPTPIIKDNGGLYSKSFTVEGFFSVARNQGHFSTYPRLVNRYSHASNATRGWELRCNPQGQVEFRVNLTDAKNNRNDITIVSKNKIKYGQFEHIAAVCDDVNKELRIYINGNLEASRKFDGKYFLHNNKGVDVVVANYAHGAESRVVIDELRMTANNTFKGVPKAPYTGKEAGTVFLFHFDQAKEKVNTPAGVNVLYVAKPELSQGVFGKAMDLTRVD